MRLLQFSAKNTEGNYIFYMKNHAKSALRSMASIYRNNSG